MKKLAIAMMLLFAVALHAEQRAAVATEFVVISYWPNRDAIHAYAGADIEKVHELPRDREFLIDPPGTLKHYDVVIDK